jgi:hypothetical protein
MVTLSPVVKLDAKETFDVFRVIPLKIIVVRLQDLILKNTYNFKKTFNDVISAGGLHNFLDFHGQILLSLIMKDEIVANFKPLKYANAINSLVPDFFTTIDGETYEGEYSLSLKEIQRIHAENKELIRLCPKYRPIGLVARARCEEKHYLKKYHGLTATEKFYPIIFIFLYIALIVLTALSALGIL